jgi:hypothetical protein
VTDVSSVIADIEKRTGHKLDAKSVHALEWRHRTVEWLLSRMSHPSRADAETGAIMFQAACKKAEEEGFQEAVKLCDSLAASRPDRHDLQVVAKALRDLHALNYGKDTYDAIQRMFEPPPSP